MAWWTLGISLGLFALVAFGAWFCGRCSSGTVAGWMELNLLRWITRQPPEDVTIRDKGSDHDPDLAFRRRVAVPQSLLAAIGLTVVFYVLLFYLVIPIAASRHYHNSLKATPQALAAMGLFGGGRSDDEAGQDAIKWLDAKPGPNDAGTQLLRELIGDEEGAVFTTGVREAARNFIRRELLDEGTGPDALVFAMIDLGGQSIGTPNQSLQATERLRDFLESMLIPPDQAPVSFDQMLLRLDIEARDEGGEAAAPVSDADPADDTTDEAANPNATGSDLIASGRYLLAIKQGLYDSLNDDEGLRVLLRALYDRIREDVLMYRRVRVLFNGRIQQVTIIVFLWALVLLGGRARVLANQRSLLNDRFETFSDEPGVSAKRGEDPPFQIVPATAPKTTTEVERELEILKDYTTYLDRKPHCTFHSFAIGALDEIYKSWLRNAPTGPPPTLRDVGRGLLTDLVERSEARLERVEYSLINYLVSAMPSLGFIGTVVGISQALGDADEVVRAADQAAQAEAITLVTATLGVAFDTTLIALVCSIPVLLLVSWYRSGESRFLLDADQKIAASLFD